MKKRLLSVLLVLCMLLSTVAMFASCGGKKGEINVSKKQVSIDLTGYGLVFDANIGDTAKKQVNQLIDLLRAQTKEAVRAEQIENEGEELESEEPMILVGDTGYKESNQAFKAIKKGGWTIQVIDNKIVILGSNTFLTHVALAYFTKNYANSETFNGATISVSKKVVQDSIGSVSVTNDAGEGRFALVYNSWTDDYDNGGRDNYNYAGDNNPTTGGADVDYTYEVVEEIRTLLAKKTGAKARTFVNKLDTTDVDTEYEILIGNMQREDYRAELNSLSVNEYGITVKNGKVMLLAWNETTLPHALAIFKDMVATYAVEDEEGNGSLALPEGFTLVETIVDPWMIEFPRPDAADLHLHGTLDVGNNSIEYIYTGDGVTEENYVAYCEKLEAAGYTMISDENYKPLNTQNIFRYYLNEETGSTLYVYYSPYEFAKEQGVKDALPSIRIIASTTEDQDLPDESILNPNQTWTKITETMVTSLTHDYSVGSWGLAYIITLEDGSFILFDGGIGTGTAKLDNKDRLWNVLNSLYKKVHGTEPTAQNPIHVRAWLLTHEHSDHMNVFMDFLKKYGKRSDFKFDNFLFNPVSDTERINSNNPQSNVQMGMENLKKAVTGGFNFLQVHTGQKFYFANCEIDIMGAHEDIYPKKLEYFNNSTSTFKTILTSTAGATGLKTSNDAGNTTTDCIWLGDLERIGSRRLRAMWGENIKADQVQIAHHGGNGVEADLYTLINAELIWWPTSGDRYIKAAGWQNNKTWCNHVDWHFAYGMPGVKMIVMSDGFDYTMTFTTNGIDYDNIYDANTWEKMTPDGKNLIDKRG